MVHTPPVARRGTLHICRKLLAGQSIARISMNLALCEKSVSGKVVDVGGARSPDYFDYLDMRAATSVEAVDGLLSGIDFETDPLPFAAGSVDTVLLCNTLEHVYRYQFLADECARILRQGGTLVGFVPFMVGYHPDPHDYFRYTREALLRLLSDAGLVRVTVEEVGDGPFLANFNTVVLSFPRVLRPLLYLCYHAADLLFLWLRPHSRKRVPLGYVFEGHKGHA